MKILSPHRILVLHLSILSYISAACLNSNQTWANFMKQYNKVYKNEIEEAYRKSVFMKNIQTILQYQESDPNNLFDISITSLTDMTPEEVQKIKTGFAIDKSNQNRKRQTISVFSPKNSAQIPVNVDWRNLTTPVMDQKTCGACWAFSAIGALEGLYARKTNKTLMLSVQNLIDCTTFFGNAGCLGGEMNIAFQYVRIFQGVPAASSYPYVSKTGMCNLQSSTTKYAQPAGSTWILPINETLLQIAVATLGPISIAIDASDPLLQFYKTGVFTSRRCRSSINAINHAVLLVGYGVTSDNVEFWLIKNSWGTGWGQQGYLQLARNQKNMCGVATYPIAVY